VVEIFKRKFLAGEPLRVNAPGTQRRIFTHIDDIVDGLMLVAEKGEGDEFGLGSEEEFSILELAHLFDGPIEMLPEVSGNRMQSSLDAARSYAIGWKARRSIREYIESAKMEKK
jgi:UDP-glucose 4-epimerase